MVELVETVLSRRSEPSAPRTRFPVPSSPFSMTSKVVQESSSAKVTFFMPSAVSASSADVMLGDTCSQQDTRGSKVTQAG